MLHEMMKAGGAFAFAGNFNYHRASETERRMAELKSIFEQIDPDEEAAAIAEAEAELDAGKGVPHEKVREWLLKLARGEITPPPCE
jgi:predicted transcriptional regulator